MVRTYGWPLICAAALAAGATTPVLVGSGNPTSDIQATIHSCPASGCEVVLTDSVYELPRELWIEGKTDFVLRRSDALAAAGIRPRLHFANGFDPFAVKGTAETPDDPERPSGWLKWPNKPGTGAGGALDQANPYSKIGYTHGGMIVVYRSRDVALKGIFLDGGAPRTFVDTGVVAGGSDLIHGTVGLNLLQSFRVRLTESDVAGFFIGVRSHGGNPFGINVEDPLTDCFEPPARLEFPEAVGEHRIDRNRLHGNIWAVASMAETDYGSLFEFNLAWDNRNDKWDAMLLSSKNAEHHAGGFFFGATGGVARHRFFHNTIVGSPLVLANNGTGTESQHLFRDNIVGGFGRIADPKSRAVVDSWQQSLQWYPDWLTHNLFEVGVADSLYNSRSFAQGQITDSAACTDLYRQPSTSCFVTWDNPVAVRFLKRWLWARWTLSNAAGYHGTYKGKTYRVIDSTATNMTDSGGGTISKIGPIDARSLGLRWVASVPWVSSKPGTTGFLQPVWNDTVVKTFVAGRASTIGSDVDLGAIQKNDSPSGDLAWKSFLTVTTEDRKCFAIPLVKMAGNALSETKIVEAKAWGVHSISRWISGMTAEPPYGIHVMALADSSLGADSVSVRVCFDSALAGEVPGTNDDNPLAVFQLVVSGKDPSTGALRTLEPVLFQWRRPDRLLRNTMPSYSSVRGRSERMSVQRTAAGWRIPTSMTEICKVRFVGLDGRTVWSGNIVPRNGELRIPSPGGLKSLFLQIRNGSGKYEMVVPGATIPSNRNQVGLRKMCG